MKFATFLVVVFAAAAQSSKTTATVIIRDASTGEAPTRFSATLVREEGFTRVGMNARIINGFYRIDGIEPGIYRLEAQGEGAYNRAVEKVLSLVAGQDLSVDVAIPRASAFAGRVVDESGQPISNSHVTLLVKNYVHGRLGYAALSRRQADSRGIYTFDGLEPGRSYVVGADRSASIQESSPETFFPGATTPDLAGEIVLSPGERREGIDIKLRKVAHYCAEGILDGIAGPVTAIETVASGLVKGMPMNLPNLAHSDPPDGSFRICGLMPGNYHLFVGSLSDPQHASYAAGEIEVEGEDLHGLRLRSMSAVAFHAESVWDGQPPERTTVKVNVPITGWRTGFTRPVSDLPVPGKAVVSADLWPGKYDVHPISLTGGGGTYVKEITWDGQRLSNGVLKINNDTKSCSIRVVVSADGSALSVRVKNGNGTSAPNSYVAIFPSDAATKEEMSDRMIVGQADQTGLYSSDNLPPGDYKIVASTDVIDSAANRIAKLWEAAATRLRIAPATAADVTVVTSPH